MSTDRYKKKFVIYDREKRSYSFYFNDEKTCDFYVDKLNLDEKTRKEKNNANQ